MVVLTFRFMFPLSKWVRLCRWFDDDEMSLLEMLLFNILLGKCNEVDPKTGGTRGKYFTNEGQFLLLLLLEVCLFNE